MQDDWRYLETDYMRSTASATWRRCSSADRGTITTENGALRDTPYFRVGDRRGTKGTSAEEMFAAAHAGSFSIALSDELAEAGLVPEFIRTTATITSKRSIEGWTVTGILLDVFASVPRARPIQLMEAAVKAKTACSISRLLSADVSMNAKLGRQGGVELRQLQGAAEADLERPGRPSVRRRPSEQ